MLKKNRSKDLLILLSTLKKVDEKISSFHLKNELIVSDFDEKHFYYKLNQYLEGYFKSLTISKYDVYQKLEIIVCDYNNFCLKNKDYNAMLNHHDKYKYALILTDLIFKSILRAVIISPCCYTHLCCLYISCVRDLTKNLSLFFDEEALGRLFIEKVVNILKFFDVDSGVRAEKMQKNLLILLNAVARSDVDRKKIYQVSHEKLDSFLQEYQTESNKISSNEIMKEQSLHPCIDPKILTNREIEKVLRNKKLPSILAQFLSKIWAKYLYVIALSDGVKSEKWNLGFEDIQLFIWSITTNSSEDLWDIYGDKMQNVIARVQQSIESIHYDFSQVDEFFSEIEKIHLAILNNEETDFWQLNELSKAMLSQADDVLEQSSKNTDYSDLQKTGAWVVINEDDTPCTYCIAKVEDSQYYLINFSGELKRIVNTDEFHSMCMSQQVKALEHYPVSETLIVYILHIMNSYLEDRQMHFKRLLHKRIEQKELVLKAEMEKNLLLKREHQRIALEQEIAQREKQRLDEMAQQIKSHLQVKIEMEKTNLETAKRDVLNLNTGTVVQLMNLSGERFETKLAMIFESSGKLIFVDRYGAKQAERSRDELAKNIVKGTEKIISQRATSDDALQNLVMNQRKKMREND